MIDAKYTKAVSSVIQSEVEISTEVTINKSSLEFTLCDRTNTSNNRGNYFSSFNLPAESSYFSTASTLSLLHPELQQLNVNKFVMIQIPVSAYTQFIDGRSIKLTFSSDAISGIVDAAVSILMYSNTYSSDKSLKYGETSPLLGDNIAYLFADDINPKYTGYTQNELGQVIHHTNPSWAVTDINNTVGAVPYLDVQGNINTLHTDTRSSVSYAVTVPTNYPASIAGYNYDIPIGFVILDKGIICMTHPSIVNNFGWNNGFYRNGSSSAGATNDQKVNIHFNDSTVASLTFVDLEKKFTMNTICMILNNEFYISNNHTWDRTIALSQFGSFNPVKITEVGLYNAFGELIAVAKFSEPVSKNIDDIMTFYITINM